MATKNIATIIGEYKVTQVPFKTALEVVKIFGGTMPENSGDITLLQLAEASVQALKMPETRTSAGDPLRKILQASSLLGDLAEVWRLKMLELFVSTYDKRDLPGRVRVNARKVNAIYVSMEDALGVLRELAPTKDVASIVRDLGTDVASSSMELSDLVALVAVTCEDYGPKKTLAMLKKSSQLLGDDAEKFQHKLLMELL